MKLNKNQLRALNYVRSHGSVCYECLFDRGLKSGLTGLQRRGLATEFHNPNSTMPDWKWIRLTEQGKKYNEDQS